MALSKVVNVGQGALALSDLIEGFQKNEKTLHLIARQSLPENAPELRLVILVDQFEKIFTLCCKLDTVYKAGIKLDKGGTCQVSCGDRIRSL